MFLSKFILTSAQLASVLGRKFFIDNDGSATGQILLPLLSGDEVLGWSASFGSSDLTDSLGASYDVLDTLNLTHCVPLYAGSQSPFLRNIENFAIWESLYGEFYWKGAFDPDYVNAYNTSDFTYNESTSGAEALIAAVKAYPGEVAIGAWGTMTTVAQALSIYPNLAKESAGIYIMGGYIDGQYMQVTGGDFVNDLNTDINLMQDPEAAQMVFTADWPELIIGGNVTNYFYTTQDEVDRIIENFGNLDKILDNPDYEATAAIVGNGTAVRTADTLPLWDEVVAGILAFPELIIDSTEVYTAIDTAFDSPFYGNLRVWPADLAPRNTTRVGKGKYVNRIDNEAFYSKLVDAYSKDWTKYCQVGGPLDV